MVAERRAASELQARLRSGQFVVTAEITPPVSTDPAEFLRRAMPLKGLAIAVNVTPRASARWDHVLVLLGQLRRIYVDIRRKDRTTPDAADEDEDHPVTTIINSIEKQWTKADQDLFIACVFLNPFIKTSLFNPQ